MNLSFKMPENYLELDSALEFWCGDAQVTPAIIYTITGADSNVIAAFSFMRYPTKEEQLRWQKIFPDANPGNNYINIAKSLGDTIRFPTHSSPERLDEQKIL